MASNRITEKAQTQTLKDAASVLITQLETTDNGTEVESLRRAALDVLVQALRGKGVNDGYISQEALDKMKPDLVRNIEQVPEVGIRVTFWDGTTLDVPIDSGGLAFDTVTYDQVSGYLHILCEGQDVVSPCFIGGGGGGSMTGTMVKLENLLEGTAFTLAHGEEFNVEFSFYDVDSSGDYTPSVGILEVQIGDATVMTRNINQGVHSIPIGSYLDEGQNRVRVKVTNEDGIYATKSWLLNAIALSISSTLDDTAINVGEMNLYYTPIGNNIEKTIHFEIDGAEIATALVTASNRQQTQLIPAQSHGAHRLRVWATATVDEVSVTSNVLVWDVIWAEEGNMTPIIACSYSGSVTQYTTVHIPYIVYNPASLTADITLLVDDEEADTLTVDRTRQNWNYKPATYGEKKLTIKCGDVTKDIALTVTEIGITIEPITTGLLLDLNPAGLTNNSADRAQFGYTDAQGANHPLTFSENFDWETGGFQTDAEGDTYFCVKCGTRATFDCGLFSDDAMRTGKEIKIVFKAANCRNYDAQVASCLSDGIGLSLQAQRATLKSEQTTMDVPYCEDRVIEMDVNIEPDSKDRAMMIWLEGVPSKVAIYAANDNFTQDQAQNFVIGSDECDVHIYRIKAYSNDLTQYEIHENWIADAPNAEKMVDRYTRNDIYDQNGDIDISKLISANPDLRVIEIYAERMTTGKEDKVTCKVVHTMKSGSDKHKFTGEGVIMKAQGTSSAQYGEAALNLDLQFKNGFTFGDGTTADVYSMTENSIGVNYFNIKLNVASSENANNVLLADEYHTYQPYINPARAANPMVRDTVEGHPCVVFFHNTSSETVQMGSISVPAGGTALFGCGDMNNSKKNLDVFGQGFDLTNYPLQCCVEISNNTNNQCLFKDANLEEETWDGKGSFEFRYPDEPTNAHKIAFQRLLSWVVSTDRTAATGAALENSATWGETTYTHDTAEYRAAKWINEVDNYFVRDSLVYHYVFTERHSMVDNRAKNVFISTDDGVHWDFTKDYDNDTGDGNDNEGGLTLTYGMEDTDTIGSKDVFNASGSVIWCNVRDLMFDDCKALFISLESKGAWDAQRILAKYKAYQSARPEALVIEDMWKKYIRPFTNNGTVAYLEMMYGTKEDQRAQYETYQEKYISSKYNSSVATSDTITFRAYTPENWTGVAPSSKITVTPYADMYVHIKSGSGEARVRAKRNTAYELECPIDTLNDTEIYLYSASNIADVGDLAPLYVGYFNIAPAIKLRRLKFGDGTEGYTNTNATSIGLGNNTLLETLDIRGCPNMAVALDLTGCGALTTLEAENSGVTGVAFARGGKIRTAHIPAVASLSAIALKELTDFTISGYGNLRTLRIEDCPVLDVLGIVRAATGVTRIRILGIDWILENTDLLDWLVGLKGLDESDHNLEQSVLTGKVYTPVMRQSKLDRYRTAWSDIVLSYDTLVQQYLVTFNNWDGSKLYEVYIDRNESCPDPVDSGAISTPARESSISTVYTYTGWDGVLTNIIAPRILTAQFSESARMYHVRWMDHLNVVHKEADYPYAADAVYDKALPTRTDEESMAVYYKFKDWNKSTGFIDRDIDVQAIWERGELPAVGTDSETLTDVQMYAIKRNNKATDYFEAKDRVLIKMGYQPEFTNIPHSDLATEMAFDGETYFDTGIKLFENGIADAWTLVVDATFSKATADSCLLSCMQDDGFMGFKVKYVNGLSVQWSTNSLGTASATDRELVILRHEAGSKNLKVYASKPASMEIGYSELTKVIDTLTDKTLIFGAAQSDTGGFSDYAEGVIHFCRLWRGDLGDTVCRKMALWPLETYRWEMGNFGSYKLAADASKSTQIDFICASLLSRYHRMNPTNTNAGGFPATEMYEWLVKRVIPALPEVWQEMMEECTVNYMEYVDGTNHNIGTFAAKIWLPSYIEMQGGTSEPWVYEGEDHIPYFTSNEMRAKFKGADKLPRDGYQHFSQDTDPAAVASNNVQDGDLWYNSTTGITRYYLRVNGDWFAAYSFFLRGASITNAAYFCYVSHYGHVGAGGFSAASVIGVCPRFSI